MAVLSVTTIKAGDVCNDVIKRLRYAARFGHSASDTMKQIEVGMQRIVAGVATAFGATAEAAGLNIPSGCNFGACGTCKVKKISGEVHMVHNGGISDDDIEAGYILACCSRPIGGVEVAI
jgi:ferredoxin